MLKPSIRGPGPEAKIQRDIVAMLRNAEWSVVVTHGNQFQQGLPDLLALHRIYGKRWIEIKNPKSYAFTPAQKELFPKLHTLDGGVWILVAATESEYNKLFSEGNWYVYRYKFPV